ncbi:MAG: hypothetical protein HIU92_03180 [Proteobacteria bacterium]|nr:hypothetical protein [Pseudomonadota bacterium]
MASPEAIREARARRFLRLCLTAFVLIFGLVWLYTATLPMAFLTRDYPAWIAKRHMLASCDLGSLAVFGDSRAMAGVEPLALPFRATNFAFSGSSPIEAYFALGRALRCKTLPKAVVIAYSSGKYVTDDDYWNISTRIGLLNFADMQSVRATSRHLDDREIDRLPPAANVMPIVREAMYALRFPTIYFDSIVNGYVFGRYLHNRDAEHAILKDRGQAFFGTADGSSGIAAEAEIPRFRLSPVIDTYFKDMLLELARRNVPVYLVSLPINDATCRQMNPGLRTGFLSYLRKTVASDPDARLLGPTMPCWHDRFFGDQFHLNASGASRFTHILAGWLDTDLSKPTTAAQVATR